jgi:YihY family inner membrane protein
MSRVDRLDRFQRRHSWLGLPLGVIYKFFDDRGTYLAAVITYYSFVSLFPLLLLFFSVAGFVLQGHPELRHDIEQTAREKIPGIGPDLSIETFHGSGLGLAVGIIGTLYGALGAMQASQASFNTIYGVPRNEQPNPFKSRLRSLGLVALLGTGVVLSTGIAAILSTANGLSPHIGSLVQVGGYILNFALNFVLFSVAFQLLTARELRLRQVMRGGLIGAGLYTLLQIFGSAFVARTAKASVYQAFAVVIATLLWFYLQSLILIVAAEINVVHDRRLWPRSLLTPFTDNVELTAADRRAYAMYAATQRFKGFEHVTTEFSDGRGVRGGDDRASPEGGDGETSPARADTAQGEPDGEARRGRAAAGTDEPASRE